MKIKLDDEILFEIDDRMMQLIAHDLMDPKVEIKRRLRYAIEHKCDQIYERLEKEWLPKLREDPKIDSIPKSKTALCDLIFSRQDYKNRVQRES